MPESPETNLSALQPLQRRPTAEVVAGRLRGAIIDGSLPLGSRLRETQLAGRLDISRAPLREALQRLIQEGLVEASPHRGVSVVMLSTEDARDIYYVRELIEVPAALALARDPNERTIELLNRVVTRMARAGRGRRWPELVELDVEFHRLIVGAAASPRLTRLFDTLGAEMRLCLGALKPAYPSHYDVAVEHRDLLAGILAADARELRRMWIAHLRNATRDLSARGL